MSGDGSPWRWHPELLPRKPRKVTPESGSERFVERRFVCHERLHDESRDCDPVNTEFQD